MFPRLICSAAPVIHIAPSVPTPVGAAPLPPAADVPGASRGRAGGAAGSSTCGGCTGPEPAVTQLAFNLNEQPLTTSVASLAGCGIRKVDKRLAGCISKKMDKRLDKMDPSVP